MCRHDEFERGLRLEDGVAHALDHEAWTRRQFVSALGLSGLGAMLGGAVPVRAVLGAPAVQPLARADSDRILVLVQMEGGNDGLNTVVPVNDDRYYNHRPSLGIRQSATLDVGQDYGLNAALEPLLTNVLDGRVQTIHAVGYDNPDLSHFRSTDIWVSGSDSNTVLGSGWMGRAVENQWPEVVTEPPSTPLAVQIGGAAMMFRGSQTSVGATFRDTEQLSRLAEGGVSYDPTSVPATRYGALMAVARDIANQSYRYAGSLQDAATQGTNNATYPDGGLAEQLAMVARLIKGGLGSKVYHVSLPGFDTHSRQAETHDLLLGEFAASTAAFMQDMAHAGRGSDVLIMTFSEFGRTVAENGSRGTDHATVAPLFLMGAGLSGPSFGTLPDLDVVNEFGDLRHIIDFRKVYATVLEQWMRIPPTLVDQTLGRSFERLDLFSASVRVERDVLPGGFRVSAPYPNPASGSVTVHVEAQAPTEVSMSLFDGLGRRVASGRERYVSAGQTQLRLQVDRLPSGSYFVRVNAGGRSFTKPVVIGR